VFTKRVHVFKAGDQTSAQGVQRKFTPKEIQQVVDTYDPSIHEAPLVLGHQGDNDSLPSYGWIKGFEREGENLYANVAFSDVAKDLVKDGHYRKVSISFYSPESQINPHKGQWSARHLALLGASPPAVKGLEPFNFVEVEGVFDYAVALSPADIFDDELGPTLIVEKSPLEMLRDKLNEVRQDVSSAVEELQNSSDTQKQTSANDQPAPNQAEEVASPDNPSSEYAEVGKEGTEIAQQTAELEDNLPEDDFMEDGKISRKHVKGANGQVMQVVENVYDEQHKESTDERKAAADRAFEAKRLKKEGKPGEAKMAKRFGKEEDEMISEDHSELEYDEVSDKTNPSPGVVKFGKKSEADNDESGRYETARSAVNGYVDRMKTGKAGAAADTGRFKTSKSNEQDSDRMHTAENGTQEKDRMNTAKAGKSDAAGESRWAGQADGYDQAMNADQYNAGLGDFPEGNKPKTASGSNPAGRENSNTKVPTETEEMPDDTIFAVSTVNVMSDGSMRVIRQKSSDARAKSVKTHDLLYAEGPEADEMTGEDGVTTARKSMKGDKMVEHAEYETGDISGDSDLETLREEIGDGKKSKSKQLTPGAMGDTDTPGQIVGPSGAFSESCKGEPKSKSKQLTPGAMDDTDDENQVTGPDGVFAESLEGLRDNIGDGKKSNAKQLTPGAMDTLTDPAEISKREGGIDTPHGELPPALKARAAKVKEEGHFAEDHGEKKGKDPYTKTGFGSTYEEGGEEGGEDVGYSESEEFCGMGSMGQSRSMNGAQQMYDELMSLKNKYAELERRHAEEKMAARRDKMAGAIGHLYTEGRLTDGIMPEQELISYCEGLEFGTLEFSEGETPATKLLSLLSKLPPMVSFGEVVSGGTFQYAEEDLDPHAKALKLVESEGIDYVEALKRSMYS
jgi:hypothetical protein